MLKGLTAHGITAGLIAVAALMALPADAQRRMAATPELAAGEKAYKGEWTVTAGPDAGAIVVPSG